MSVRKQTLVSNMPQRQDPLYGADCHKARLT